MKCDPLIEAYAALSEAELRIQTAKARINEAIIGQGEPRNPVTRSLMDVPCGHDPRPRVAEIVWDGTAPPDSNDSNTIVRAASMDEMPATTICSVPGCEYEGRQHPMPSALKDSRPIAPDFASLTHECAIPDAEQRDEPPARKA